MSGGLVVIMFGGERNILSCQVAGDPVQWLVFGLVFGSVVSAISGPFDAM